jgi:hypothetical protein
MSLLSSKVAQRGRLITQIEVMDNEIARLKSLTPPQLAAEEMHNLLCRAGQYCSWATERWDETRGENSEKSHFAWFAAQFLYPSGDTIDYEYVRYAIETLLAALKSYPEDYNECN